MNASRDLGRHDAAFFMVLGLVAADKSVRGVGFTRHMLRVHADAIKASAASIVPHPAGGGDIVYTSKANPAEAPVVMYIGPVCA